MLVAQGLATVRYPQSFGRITGRQEEQINTAEIETIEQLLDYLWETYGGAVGFLLDEQGSLRSTARILINGSPVVNALDQRIRQQDVITILPSNPKVYFETYGCSASLADAEMTIGQLLMNGFEIAKSPEEADVNIIVTCTVKSATANHMISRIGKLSSTNLPLVVTGCMPKTEMTVIEKINPKASMLGPNSIENSVEVVRSAIAGKKLVIINDSQRPKLQLPKFRINPIVEILEIASGCLSACTFCQVKIAKGRLRSYPIDQIADETNRAVREGCKEIWLTSTDNGCYGKDMRTNLAELINSVSNVEGNFWVRVGMMNPIHLRRITSALLKSYSSSKVFKFLHIPVQSGSETILKAMKRGHTVKDFEVLANNFRNAFPFSSLSTDIIVGYPDESSGDFGESLSLIERVQPDVVNISKFGARAGTEAAKLKQLPTNVVSTRTKELVDLVKSAGRIRNERWLGWEGEIIVDEKGTKQGTWVGRNAAYRPVVVANEQKLFGKTVEVRINNITNTYLLGNMVGRVA